MAVRQEYNKCLVLLPSSQYHPLGSSVLAKLAVSKSGLLTVQAIRQLE